MSQTCEARPKKTQAASTMGDQDFAGSPCQGGEPRRKYHDIPLLIGWLVEWLGLLRTKWFGAYMLKQNQVNGMAWRHFSWLNCWDNLGGGYWLHTHVLSHIQDESWMGGIWIDVIKHAAIIGRVWELGTPLLDSYLNREYDLFIIRVLGYTWIHHFHTNPYRFNFSGGPQ